MKGFKKKLDTKVCISCGRPVRNGHIHALAASPVTEAVPLPHHGWNASGYVIGVICVVYPSLQARS